VSLPIFAFAILMGLMPIQANAETWLKGGPISDALESAVTNKDKRSLKKIWSGKLLMVQSGSGLVTAISVERLFKMVDGCVVLAKYDDWRTQTDQEKEDLKGLVAWSCKSKRIKGSNCDYEQYSLELGIVRPFSNKTGLYVIPSEGYDSVTCDKPVPPLPSGKSD
jgi:hypothetical protein